MLEGRVKTLPFLYDKSLRFKSYWQVLMVNNDDNVRILNGYLEPYGIVLDEEQLRKLLKHIDLVGEKNKVMNLTRIVDPTDAMIRHIVDSLLLLPSIETHVDTNNARFVDIGTGAGFPGIPMGIATNMYGTLIDSVGKKSVAVGEFIDELSLGDRLTSMSIRAEDLARREHGTYDLIVARAVAELGVLVEYASPLLKKNGYLMVSKANVSDNELTHGNRTGKTVGLSYVSRETYELPNESGHREIITYIHDAKSKISLPRKNGDAKHKPLVQ